MSLTANEREHTDAPSRATLDARDIAFILLSEANSELLDQP